MQALCKENIDWDDPLPEVLKAEWERWRNDVLSFQDLQVKRCLKPEEFEAVEKNELHYFSDASCFEYCQ